MPTESFPKPLSQPFNHTFPVRTSGLHAVAITARCKHGEDLRVEIDNLQFREVPPDARAQYENIPPAWNGSNLLGLKKTVIFLMQLTAGDHVIKFIPHPKAMLEERPTATLIEDPENILLTIENWAEDGNRRPWYTIVLVDLPLKVFSAEASVRWYFLDPDDIKLIVDGKIKQNPTSRLHKYWLWKGSLLRTLQGKEREEYAFEENLRQGVHYIEFWADRKPTLHQVKLNVGKLTPPEPEPEPEPEKRIPTVDDPKWTGDFNDDPTQIILARAIFGEARDLRLSDTDRIAVGWSIRNRVEVKREDWGSTYHEVITDPRQYSSFNLDDEKNRPFVEDPLKNNIPDNVTAWPHCYELAGQVISGEVNDPTAGSNHYYDESIKTPYWASPETFVVKIGPFFFHKL